jgi:arylsulfatase
MSSTGNRNLVLVTADSLRADHCGFLGGGRPDLTPTLDAMAREGVVFENAIAPGPRTPSSMPESFTGESLCPERDGDTDASDYWERRRALIRRHMRRHRSVAERLRERGYATVGVTVNPWTQGTGFDAGFDRYVEINGETLGSYGSPVFRGVDRALRGTRVGERLFWHNKREWFIRWTDFYDRIAEELDAAARPVFLWVFLLDTHQPYVTPRQFRSESSALGMYYASFSELSRNGRIPGHVRTRLRRAYRDSVRSVDAFFERLRADGAGDDPIFVVHSDHGEAFGEHGTYGHECRLYRENLHVPVLVANARRTGRVREPFSLRRLPALLTALADRGTFDPGPFTSDVAVSTTEDDRAISVSGWPWKLIRERDGDREELYRLDADPAERTNLVEQHPGAARTLGAVADRRRSDRIERSAIVEAARQTGAVREAPGELTDGGHERQ